MLQMQFLHILFLSSLAFGARMRASPNGKPAVTSQASNRSQASGNLTKPTVTAKAMTTPFFTLLMKEWKEVPELGPFTDRCVPLIEKLLPRLRMEYTKLQVPKVLLHDCDVYVTKTDYQTNNTSLDTARGTCRISARELGEQYMGDQDYKSWCTNLHAYLMEQANLHEHESNKAELMAEAEKIRQELEELRKQYEEMQGKLTSKGDCVTIGCSKMPCCPSTCRPC